MDFATLLKQHGLRDTQPRRLVLKALSALPHPATPQELEKTISKKGDAVNTVTIYRMLQQFLDAHIIHRHGCDGSYSLCTLPEVKGPHISLHCESCGTTTEVTDESFAKSAKIVSKTAGFTPLSHLTEIIGLCRKCA